MYINLYSLSKLIVMTIITRHGKPMQMHCLINSATYRMKVHAQLALILLLLQHYDT